jgi:serine/threonine protein kinase
LDPDTEALGEGAFATVYLGTDKRTGERVAVKRIGRAYTDEECFKREMRALQHISQFGGHPNICSLHDYYEDDAAYYVVLDYVRGGEMFDNLIRNGAYSEADAARLTREIASALAFLHGIGVVHSDLKPENIMLSAENVADSAVKLVDFGSSDIPGGEKPHASFTPAYASPEAFHRDKISAEPAMDMWALGIILYIMLVGRHPYILQGQATDTELEERIRTNENPPPIRNSPITAHLSESAIDLLERLIERDPEKRLTAGEMLEHPWVCGKTATTDIIAGSDERLSRIRAMKTQLQADFFKDAVTWSDNADHTRRKTSLIEKSFKSMYEKNSGFLPLIPTEGEDDATEGAIVPEFSNSEDASSLSMAEFHGLLSENMKHKFFPRNHIVYNEGDVGNHMYIINSGSVEVTTSHGSRAERTQGDFFGEGALLHPRKIRSGTIRCKTPVHVIEISREYFEKYLASSELGLMLAVKEKDRIRKRNRAKMILRMQNNLKTEEFKQGDYLYQEGKPGDALYIVEGGKVRVLVNDKHVFSASDGNVCGEYAALTGRKRNSTALCETPRCTTKTMSGRDFRKLMDLYPDAKASLRDLTLRRDFKKAVVLRLNKEFPYENPMEAFIAVGVDARTDLLDADSIAEIMRDMDPAYTDAEILEVIRMMDLTNSGTVCFDEFRKVFVADIRTSASI